MFLSYNFIFIIFSPLYTDIYSLFILNFHNYSSYCYELAGENQKRRWLWWTNVMMLGSKGLLTPLIPDCSALRALTILKNIRNPLIFLRKMASYSCFWRVPRLKIFMQASLHQISNLLTLVSGYLIKKVGTLACGRWLSHALSAEGGPCRGH